MVVGKGYKQTEVGVIPVNWNISSIGNECKIFGRIGFRGYTINDIVGEGKGAITLSPSNIQDDELNIKKVTYISWFKYEESPEIKIYNGDILLVKTGSTFGKTAFVKGLNEKATVNPQIVVLKNIKCEAQFLGYIMKSPIIQSQINSFIVGGAIPTLSQEQVKKFKIPIPPLPEQTAIATALSDMDALIAQTEKLIEKKKTIKQGVMQELLRPKDGWVTKKIPEVCWFQEGPGVRKHQFTQNGVKLLNGTNIQSGKLDLENTDKFISENEAFGWYSHFLVDNHDILIACSGVSIDKFHEKVTVADKHHLPLCMNTSTMRFKVDSKQLDKSYFIQFLKSKNFKEQISGKATGSAQLNFGPSHVKMIEISLPSIEKQIEIGNILDDFENQIIKCETKLQKLKLQKQGMMQALLTGKIRLV